MQYRSENRFPSNQMRSTKNLKLIYRLTFLLLLSGLTLSIYFTFSLISTTLFKNNNLQLEPLPFPKQSLLKLKRGPEIPRIIHQTYQSSNLPLKYSTWQKTCKDIHPDWTYKLWTNTDLDLMIESDFPWLSERFTGFYQWINRVDLARYAILYKYGGFFIDLDIECLYSLDRFAKMGGAIIPRMSFNTSTAVAFWEHNFPNSLLGSVPGHLLWMDAMQSIAKSTKQGVENVTGSIFLHDLIHRYKKIEHATADNHLHELHILDPGLIYPFDWRIETDMNPVCAATSPSFSPTRCKELVKIASSKWNGRKAYTVSYWTKRWGLGKWMDDILAQPIS